MEDNGYDRYDLSLPWIPERQQAVRGPQPKEEPTFPEESPYEYAYGEESQQKPVLWNRQIQRDGPKPDYMPRAEGLLPLTTLKKYLIIGSILLFGFISGLAVSHVMDVAASQQGPSPYFHAPSSDWRYDDDHHFFHHFHHHDEFESGNGNPSQFPFGGSNDSQP